MPPAPAVWRLLTLLSVCGACAPSAARPQPSGFGISIPTSLGEGSGDRQEAAVPPAPKKETQPADPIPAGASQPDPEPLRQSEQWEYELEWNAGTLSVVGVRPRSFQSPVVTARKIGRFAIELWVGAELVDRIRFDLPLLGADEPRKARSAGPAPPSLEQGVRVRHRVLVPAASRARRAVLVDRATSKTTILDWPPRPTS